MAEIDRWSNLHPDLLYQITEHLYSYHDYIRLRLVCKEWNSKLSSIPNHKRNPWLLLPGTTHDSSLSHILEKEQIYHVMFPDFDINDNLIRGSCHGWLITVVISEGAIRMLNPFTKTHIDLPPVSTFSDVVRYHPDRHGDEYVLVDLYNDVIYNLDAISFHKYEIQKIVISSPPNNDDFMAVAIYKECGKLAVCKLNDKRWTHIPTEQMLTFFQDVIFFQDKIYALDDDTSLYEFDKKVIMDELGKKPRPQLVPLLTSIGGMCEAPPPAKLTMYYTCSMNKYVIGCVDGSLLMIVKHNDWAMEMLHVCNKFDVFKLNKNSKEWSRMHSLEDYAVMIGYNSSVQMFPGKSPYCKRNHIYYTDNQVVLHTLGKPSLQDMGILNLEDTNTNEILPNVEWVCPPTWLLP
ncbi:putative F-box protein At5g55150 [Arachis duranensis]|uniref:F-box protein At5g55150 n=1 Tax=Arachis duranensis TaxID=130453 RepID=A0A6P4DCY8_ARADU|nr:putative F-box protein At5g55150 [Arachis duranensis]